MTLSVFAEQPDGSSPVDITELCQEVTSTHVAGAPWQATVKMSDLDGYSTDWMGLRCRIVDPDVPSLSTELGDTIDHYGQFLLQSDDSEEDDGGSTVLTSYGPDLIWGDRPARDGAASTTPGNYSKPTFLSERGVNGAAQVMLEVLEQSEDDSDPNAGEGPTGIIIDGANFAGACTDISGAPADYPLTIAQLRSMLQETGTLDIVVIPTNTSGEYGTAFAACGDFGTNRTGDFSFQYGLGDLNVAKFKRTRDATKIMNKLYYYLGPKIDDQHWRHLITATDLGITGMGAYAAMIAARADSRDRYRVRMDIRILDSFSSESDSVPLYWNLWMIEELLRQKPKTIATFTPDPEFLPQFDIFDLVNIQTDGRHGGIDEAQRVYGRTMTWDENGTRSYGEIKTSPDNESA